jgi:hypothetical protein
VRNLVRLIIIFGTDRLRRQEAMKTADRENPIHGATWPRNRARGALGQNRTSSIEWAEKQEKFQPQEKCFFLTSPFIELSSGVRFAWLCVASRSLTLVLVWRILTRRKALRTAPPVAALPQRGVESMFPTDVVDGPEDLRFVSCGEA